MTLTIFTALLLLAAIIGYGFGQSSMDSVVTSYQDDIFELSEKLKSMEAINDNLNSLLLACRRANIEGELYEPHPTDSLSQMRNRMETK